MSDIWRKTFLMWSETKQFISRVAQAEQIVDYGLKKKPYVAYSGGKDSLCMLHLVCKKAPYILVYHHSQGKYMPEEVGRDIILNAREAGAKNIRVYPAKRDFWTDIIKEIERRGYDSVFVGLRKEESSGRRARIKEKNRLTSFQEFWPLQNWTWMDVWAYIVKNNLSYPFVYDKEAEMTGTYEKLRFHSFFDPSMDRFGRRNVDGVSMWRHKNE